MKVQEFIRDNGLQSLTQFGIKIREYEDRVGLNYDQIKSPKFHPIADECRALILWKDTWEVAARSFIRFWNVGEDPDTADFPIVHRNTRIEQKIDGSIISLYWDKKNNRWQPASRSCCFGEGESLMGNTFANIFYKAIEGTMVMDFLNSAEDSKEWTWVFELVSPETRVVTPFTVYKVFLTAAVLNSEGAEMDGKYLDEAAKKMLVDRPIRYSFNSIEEAIEKANSLPSMEEGFVLVYEGDAMFWRMKLKNTKYLAIAHMRNNGVLSPKRILTLIMANDHAEYLSYFKDDLPYFDFVEDMYLHAFDTVKVVWEKHKDIPVQKDYALTIIPLCEFDWQKGVLFNLRKGMSWENVMKGCDPKKLALSMGLKEKLQKKFSIKLDDEEDV